MFRIFLFYILGAFPFSPFLIFQLQWLTFYWAWSSSSKKSEKAMTVFAGNFALEFFTQISQHFRAYFRRHRADHSEYRWWHYFSQTWWCQKWNKGLGTWRAVTGSSSNSCSQAQMMTLLSWLWYIAMSEHIWSIIRLVLFKKHFPSSSNGMSLEILREFRNPSQEQTPLVKESTWLLWNIKWCRV